MILNISDDIKGWSSAVELRFAEDGEGGTKGFPIDIGGEAFQETIELVNLVRIRFGGNKVGLHRQVKKVKHPHFIRQRNYVKLLEVAFKPLPTKTYQYRGKTAGER